MSDKKKYNFTFTESNYEEEPTFTPSISEQEINRPYAGFNAEGTGYDYETALKHGIKPDSTGHWQSRVPETGQLLKGRQHETFDKTIKGEEEAGYQIIKGKDGKYYSQLKMIPTHIPTNGKSQKPEDVVFDLLGLNKRDQAYQEVERLNEFSKFQNPLGVPVNERPLPKVNLPSFLQNRPFDENLRQPEKIIDASGSRTIGLTKEQPELQAGSQNNIGEDLILGLKNALTSFGEGGRRTLKGIKGILDKPTDLRQYGETAVGGFETILGALPPVIGLNIVSPTVDTATRTVAKEIGVDENLASELVQRALPFVFGKWVGTGSLTAEAVTEGIKESKILNGMSPESRKTTEDLIYNGIFLGIASGGGKIEKSLKDKKVKQAPEVKPKESEKTVVNPEVEKLTDVSKEEILSSENLPQDLPTAIIQGKSKEYLDALERIKKSKEKKNAVPEQKPTEFPIRKETGSGEETRKRDTKVSLQKPTKTQEGKNGGQAQNVSQDVGRVVSKAGGGKIETLYHATQSEKPFTEFKAQSFGELGEHSYFYFSDKPNVLQKMTKAGANKDQSPVKRIVKAEVSVKKPLDLTNIEGLTLTEWKKLFENKGVKLPEDIIKSMDNAQNQGNTRTAWQIFRHDNGRIHKALQDAGYDGIKWNEWGGTTTVALSPKQIKILDKTKPTPPPESKGVGATVDKSPENIGNISKQPSKTAEYEDFIDELTNELERSGKIRTRAILDGKRSKSTVNIDRLAQKYNLPKKLVDNLAGQGTLSSLESDPKIMKEAIKKSLEQQLKDYPNLQKSEPPKVEVNLADIKTHQESIKARDELAKQLKDEGYKDTDIADALDYRKGDKIEEPKLAQLREVVKIEHNLRGREPKVIPSKEEADRKIEEGIKEELLKRLEPYKKQIAKDHPNIKIEDISNQELINLDKQYNAKKVKTDKVKVLKPKDADILLKKIFGIYAVNPKEQLNSIDAIYETLPQNHQIIADRIKQIAEQKLKPRGEGEQDSKKLTEKLNKQFEDEQKRLEIYISDRTPEEVIADKLANGDKLTPEETKIYEETQFAPEGYKYDVDGNLIKLEEAKPSEPSIEKIIDKVDNAVTEKIDKRLKELKDEGDKRSADRLVKINKVAKEKFDKARDFLLTEIKKFQEKAIDEIGKDVNGQILNSEAPDFKGKTKEILRTLIKEGKIEDFLEKGEKLTDTEIANQTGFWGDMLGKTIKLNRTVKLEIPDDGTVTLREPTLGYLLRLEKDIKSTLKWDAPQTNLKLPTGSMTKTDIRDKAESFENLEQAKEYLKENEANLKEAQKKGNKNLQEVFQNEYDKASKVFEIAKRLDYEELKKQREERAQFDKDLKKAEKLGSKLGQITEVDRFGRKSTRDLDEAEKVERYRLLKEFDELDNPKPNFRVLDLAKEIKDNYEGNIDKAIEDYKNTIIEIKSNEKYFTKKGEFRNVSGHRNKQMISSLGDRIEENQYKIGDINTSRIELDRLLKSTPLEKLKEEIKTENRVVKEETYKQAKENIKQKNIEMLKKNPSGLGQLDPSILKDYAIVGSYHLENVARKGIQKGKEYAEWTKEMLKELGEDIKPYLKEIWDEVNKKPEEKTLKASKATENPYKDWLENQPDVILEKRKTVGVNQKGERGAAFTQKSDKGFRVIYADYTPETSFAKEVGRVLSYGLTPKQLKEFSKEAENLGITRGNLKDKFASAVKKLASDPFLIKQAPTIAKYLRSKDIIIQRVGEAVKSEIPAIPKNLTERKTVSSKFESEIKDKSHYKSLSKVTNDGELNEYFKAIGENADKPRGVMTKELVEDLAGSLGLSQKDIMGLKSGDIRNVEQVTGMRQVVVDNTNELRNFVNENPKLNTENAEKLKNMYLINRLMVSKVMGLASESARVLQSLNRRMDAREFDLLNEIYDKLQQAGIKDIKNPKEFNQKIKEVLKPSFGDKTVYWWYNSLLFNPLTDVANITGNATYLGSELIQRTLWEPQNTGRVLKGVKNAWKDIQKDVKDIWNAEQQDIAKYDFDVNKLKEQYDPNPNSIQNTLVKNILKGGRIILPINRLRVEDALFRNVAKNIEREVSIKNLGKKFKESDKTIRENLKRVEATIKNNELGKDLNDKEKAFVDAVNDYNLYAEDLTFIHPLGKTGQYFQRATSSNAFLKWLFPFIRISVNLTKEGLKQTPYYLTKSLGEEGLSKLSKGFAESKYSKDKFSNLSPRQKDIMLRRAIIGSVAIAGLQYLTSENEIEITGTGPRTKKQKEKWLENGYKPEHIYFGKTGIPYSAINPYGVLLSIMGNVSDYQKYDTKFNDEDNGAEEKISLMLGKMTETFLDQSFVWGLQQLYKSIQYGDANLLGKIVTSPVPNIGGMVRGIKGDYTRYEQKSIGDILKYKLGLGELGITDELEPKKTKGKIETSPYRRFPFQTSEKK